ncbi:MAG: ion transporter [Alphaproteobacteria bacterium]|nr:ion transporter [Alphaproteobacteria bacterium]
MTITTIPCKKHWIDSCAARMIIGFTILLNAIILGVLTFLEPSDPRYAFLTNIDHAVAVIFVLEMLLRLTVHHKHFFKNGWNTFDFIVVFGSLIPLGGSINGLRALRIFRLFYFIEVSPKLRHILHGIYYALPGFLSVTILLLIAFYVYAVIGVNLFKHPGIEGFQNLGTSFHTLFQVITGDDWYAVMRTVTKEFPYGWIYFYSYYVTMVFITLNLFIGVIVGSLQNAEADLEHQKKEDASNADDDIHEKMYKEIISMKKEIQKLSKK